MLGFHWKALLFVYRKGNRYISVEYNLILNTKITEDYKPTKGTPLGRARGCLFWVSQRKATVRYGECNVIHWTTFCLLDISKSDLQGTHRPVSIDDAFSTKCLVPLRCAWLVSGNWAERFAMIDYWKVNNYFNRKNISNHNDSCIIV